MEKKFVELELDWSRLDRTSEDLFATHSVAANLLSLHIRIFCIPPFRVSPVKWFSVNPRIRGEVLPVE